MATDKQIPLEIAQRLCGEHREKNGVKLFSQCWGCVRFSKDTPEKMCFYMRPNNDGCRFVNKRFATLKSHSN